MRPQKTLRFSLIAAMCLGGVVLPAQPRNQVPYTRSELRRLIREAHTDQQYRALANCFRTLEAHFRRKAAEEDQEYQRLRSRALPAKYPTPADSVKGLRDYHRYRAAQAAAMAVKFESKTPGVDHPAEARGDALLERLRQLEQEIRQLRREAGLPSVE